MSRARGGYIGFNRVPAAAGINSAASGVWSLREAEALKRAGTWPRVFEDPTSVPGLQLWLDAADASTLYDATTGGSLVAADGGVARWEDKSGNARHATQSTSANRPARKTAIVNSKDALLLDGTNDGLSVNALATVFNGSNKTFSVFGVAQANTTSGTRDFFSAAKANNNQQNVRCMWNNGSQKAALNREPPSGGSTKSVVGGTNLGTSTRLLRWTFDGTDGRIFVNGSSDATAVNLTQSSLDLDTAAVGFLPRLSPTVFFSGYICEVCVFNAILSDAERQTVEDYLIDKWAIT